MLFNSGRHEEKTNTNIEAENDSSLRINLVDFSTFPDKAI